ncbi:MAG: 50S ribosomal protein L22 [Saprospiraceae bacterium]
MEAVAKLKNCPMSARKMRMVVDTIRGKRVEDALNILKFTNREAAIWVEKVLLSAIANWENKSGSLSAEDYNLIVSRALVDDGMILKRFRPAPHGRAHRIRKRTNHITLAVSNKLAISSDLAPAHDEEE